LLLPPAVAHHEQREQKGGTMSIRRREGSAAVASATAAPLRIRGPRKTTHTRQVAVMQAALRSFHIISPWQVGDRRSQRQGAGTLASWLKKSLFRPEHLTCRLTAGAGSVLSGKRRVEQEATPGVAAVAANSTPPACCCLLAITDAGHPPSHLSAFIAARAAAAAGDSSGEPGASSSSSSSSNKTATVWSS
jgi:hypothetical protein